MPPDDGAMGLDGFTSLRMDEDAAVMAQVLDSYMRAGFRRAEAFELVKLYMAAILPTLVGQPATPAPEEP